MGQIFVFAVTFGICRFSRHLPSRNLDLMEALEYVRAYIDNLLVITRGTLEDHLDKLGEVLRRLREAGLKVNAAKSFFCTHEIEYLGYILTRGGIKPQPKKKYRRFLC